MTQVNTFLRQLTLWPFSLLISTFPFKLFTFSPFVGTWYVEQPYSTANARISWRVARSFSSANCSLNLSPLFWRFALERMCLKSAWISRASNTEGVTSVQKSEMETDTALSSDLEKKSAWLRGACRGQVVYALPCSKLSSSYNISDKCESTLFSKNLLWGRFCYLLKQTALVCTCCSQVPIDR